MTIVSRFGCNLYRRLWAPVKLGFAGFSDWSNLIIDAWIILLRLGIKQVRDLFIFLIACTAVFHYCTISK
jgi:hypothetical protein